MCVGGEVGCDDRDMLLETQCLLQKGLRWTHLFRSSHRGGGEMRGEGEEGEDPVVLMHGELVYALTRVRVKLAATLPPPGQTTATALHFYELLNICLRTVAIKCVYAKIVQPNKFAASLIKSSLSPLSICTAET